MVYGLRPVWVIVTKYSFLVSKDHDLRPVWVIVTKYSFLLSTDHGLWSTACLGNCYKVEFLGE